jgi:peptidoglycan/LPS O-acetylase OafA/YrhL
MQAPDALRPPPGNPRFPMIDGLRAVAAITVLVGHASYLSTFNGHGAIGAVFSRLDVGVALFFVISGFLLYRPFVAARYNGKQAPRVLRYARRRALRILPAYWLALTALTIWPGLDGDVFGHAHVYYLFLQDFRVGWILGGIPAAWSLAVEVQFYALLPVVAIVLASVLRGRSLRTQVAGELAVFWALAGASIVVRQLTFADPTPDTWSNTIAGTFLWFALGMTMAVVSAASSRPVSRPRALRALDRYPWASWLIAGALFLMSSRIGLPTAAPQRYTPADWLWSHVIYGFVALFAVAPAALALVDRRSLCYRAMTFGPVAWLGLVSYGIFLWHQPFTEEFLPILRLGVHGVVVLYTLAVFAVATACAAVSYYAVERPILRFKDPRRDEREARGSDQGAGAAAVPALGTEAASARTP